MKQIISLCLSVFLATTLQSQIIVSDWSGKLLSGTTSVLPVSQSYEAYNFSIQNAGSNAGNFIVEVTDFNRPENTDLQFCIGNCFNLEETTNLPLQIGTPLSIAAGDTYGEEGNHDDELADVLYFPDGEVGQAFITFRIYQQGNEANSTTITLDNTVTGLSKIGSSPLFYPNPASNSVMVSSDTDFDFVILTNISGQIVKTTTEHKISVADLENGLYFYTIFYKNSKSESGKFVVSK